MNPRLISKVVGLILLPLAAGQAVCLLVSYLDHERHPGLDAVEAFTLSTGMVFITAVLLVILGRGSGSEILRREAIAVVGLGWFVCAGFGALPYIFCEPRLGFVDAFFESMSGFTTTGASVISNVERLPRALLLWRSLSQWLGGMGIVVLFVAILSSFRNGSKAIFHHESSAVATSNLDPRISRASLDLWLIYLGLSLVCFLGLRLLGLSFFDALCHTFTTISTGGFSTHSQSIAYFESLWVELWLVLFMILGGISFMFYGLILKGRRERWRQDEETKVFFAALLAVSLVIALDLLFMKTDRSLGHALRVSVFHVVSIMSTTGFVTSDFNQWPALSTLLLLVIMAAGGCAGSTAGGIKLSRWILFFKIVRKQMKVAFRPKQVISLSMNGSKVAETLQIDTLFFIALSGVTVLCGTVLMSLFQPGLDLESSLSAVLATLFNIGPGLGAVGPMSNFAELAPYTKVLLSFLMVVGRLEFYTVMVLFVPSIWKAY